MNELIMLTLILPKVFEDLHAYMASLQLLKDLQASTLYPGHGAIVSDPNKHIEAYIKNREKREEMILAALGDNLPKTIDEIVSDVYKVCIKYLAYTFVCCFYI